MDWNSEAIVFSNQVAEVYWVAEEWVDNSTFSNRIRGRATKHPTGKHYLLSRLDLESKVCVEEFISEDEFKRVLFLKQECIRQFPTERISNDAKVLDANCNGRFMVVWPDGFRSRVPVIIGDGISNAVTELSPYTSIGDAGISEAGDCFFVSMTAGLQREYDQRLAFAIFKQGFWWTGNVPGVMPPVSDKSLVRTSTISELVQVHLSP